MREKRFCDLCGQREDRHMPADQDEHLPGIGYVIKAHPFTIYNPDPEPKGAAQASKEACPHGCVNGKIARCPTCGDTKDCKTFGHMFTHTPCPIHGEGHGKPAAQPQKEEA